MSGTTRLSSPLSSGSRLLRHGPYLIHVSFTNVLISSLAHTYVSPLSLRRPKVSSSLGNGSSEESPSTQTSLVLQSPGVRPDHHLFDPEDRPLEPGSVHDTLFPPVSTMSTLLSDRTLSYYHGNSLSLLNPLGDVNLFQHLN